MPGYSKVNISLAYERGYICGGEEDTRTSGLESRQTRFSSLPLTGQYCGSVRYRHPGDWAAGIGYQLLVILFSDEPDHLETRTGRTGEKLKTLFMKSA